MHQAIVIAMSIFTLFGCGRKKAPVYPSETFTAHDGTEFTITFFGHASLAIGAGGRHIYVDPVGAHAQYAHLPKADIILLTHSHSDHFDRATVEKLRTSKTAILSDRTTAEAFGMEGYVMRPGSIATLRDYVKVEAVAAYNTTREHQQFHPKLREDCGYLLTIGGTRIYIAGDTEPTPEMKALRDVGIAFLPVNQPYTMTVDQVVEVIRSMKPLIFYPYHYGQVDTPTDLERLVREVEALGTTDIRIQPME